MVIKDEISILRSLPDIHREIAQAMEQFRQLVEDAHSDMYPDVGERTSELLESWLEIQKEDAKRAIRKLAI